VSVKNESDWSDNMMWYTATYWCHLVMSHYVSTQRKQCCWSCYFKPQKI